MHSLHRNEQKVFHKIIRKIDIKNVTRVFLTNELIISKNQFKKTL